MSGRSYAAPGDRSPSDIGELGGGASSEPWIERPEGSRRDDEGASAVSMLAGKVSTRSMGRRRRA